ncbi:hypothetical protein O4H52_09655 [Sphingomonadaceae bacterium G21617-S1]|nr:hypothetical protein [Sphingomonadaceae bacterium G21617-S1]
MRWSRHGLLVGIMACTLSLQGCAAYPTFEQGLRVKWADDVGSVTISRSGDPIEWADIASDLEPKFKMDSATALAAAIPTTQSFDERLADILTANLQVGLPTSSYSRATTEVTDPETGELVTTTENKKSRQSGAAPTAAAMTPQGAAALTALSAGALNDDPMLRYLAATALQQEVALLNRYIRSVAAAPETQAFVVRLQLTVMPNARSMPYDVEADITLHAEDEQSRAGLSLGLQLNEEGYRAKGTGPMLSPATLIENRQNKCAAGSYPTLQILPMIVTDNLEGLRAARSTDNVRQLALALVGTAGNVGGSGQFGRTMEALRRTEGRDTNSLLTVAKLSDDTVRVRLGAVQSPRYGHVMAPRNHFISLVVIYQPCVSSSGSGYEVDGRRLLTAVTRTVFRDGDTGKTLEYRPSTARLHEQIARVQDTFPGDFNYLELARMYQWVSRQERERFFAYVLNRHPQAGACNNFFEKLLGRSYFGSTGGNYHQLLEGQDYLRKEDRDFALAQIGARRENRPPPTREPLKRPYPGKGTIERWDGGEVSPFVEDQDVRCLTLARTRYQMVAAPLWTELQALRPTGQYAFTNIPITLRKRTPTLPPFQTALILNGDSDSSVTLYQGKDLVRQPFSVVLYDAATKTTLRATETNVPADGKSITAKFQKLSRFDIDKKAKLDLTVWLATKQDNCVATEQDKGRCQIYTVTQAEASPGKAPPPFTIAATASAILADPVTGRGRLVVSATKSKDNKDDAPSMYLSVEGAQLATVQTRAGVVLPSEAEGWKVTAAGDLLLDLENLIPNTLVKVTLRNSTTSADPVSRSVVAGAARRSD